MIKTASITKQDLGRNLKRVAKDAGIVDSTWKARRQKNQQRYKVKLIPISENIKTIFTEDSNKEELKEAEKKLIVKYDASQL